MKRLLALIFVLPAMSVAIAAEHGDNGNNEKKNDVPEAKQYVTKSVYEAVDQILDNQGDSMDSLFIGAGGEGDLALAVEQVGDGAVGAQVAAQGPVGTACPAVVYSASPKSSSRVILGDGTLAAVLGQKVAWDNGEYAAVEQALAVAHLLVTGDITKLDLKVKGTDAYALAPEDPRPADDEWHTDAPFIQR